MNVLQRIRVGIDLVSHARRAWGSDQFWDVIGWWHCEVHYTIPRIEEEKRIAQDMSNAFAQGTLPIDLDQWLGLDPVVYTKDSNTFTISVPDQVGYWDWNGIKVGANKRPSPLRCALVNVLLGAKWVDTETKKNRAEPGPEYKRLEGFLATYP